MLRYKSNKIYAGSLCKNLPNTDERNQDLNKGELLYSLALEYIVTVSILTN